MILAALIPLIAQASTPMSFEEARRSTCLEEARTDPATAISTANVWLGESSGFEQAFAQECLGIAYTRLLRWDAARRAFHAARDLAPDFDPALRARFATMAGNAALAAPDHAAALEDFDLAILLAHESGDAGLAGEIELDRARALVGLGEIEQAEAVLEIARRDAPQNAETWLLSATLSRRLERLDIAQSQIANAAGLNPYDPAIALEAGLIAVLAGRDEAARESWQSAIELAPQSEEAELARGYIAQLDELAGESSE